MKTIFFISLAIILYTYVGYPVLLVALGNLRRRHESAEDYEPTVTVVIAAFNEASCIRETVLNKLSLDYPPEKLDVVVVSDGSTDGTDEIVRSIGDPRVRLFRQECRAGKTAALNRAVSEAKGEIIVFADANSMYEHEAVRALVSNFRDPRVGYVTGKMLYSNPDGSICGDGCTVYMRYENMLRLLETRIGSIVGVDGGIDAARRELYRKMREDQLPDLVFPLKVVEQGYRVVYEARAVLREKTLTRASEEYRMRVRVALRALWALRDMKHLLNPFRFGLFAWQLASHKILRYAAFVFLLAAYLSSAFLKTRSVDYAALFYLQSGVYTMAVASHFMERVGVKLKILALPYYFTLVNVAAAHAAVKFMLGHKISTWTPRKG